MENSMPARQNTVQGNLPGKSHTSTGRFTSRKTDKKVADDDIFSSLTGWEKIVYLLKNSRKNFAVITIFLTALVTILVILLWTSSSNYRPLYGSQEPYNNSDILAALETENIKYQMQPDTGLILVEDGRVAEIRMLLASKGVKATLPEGLSVLGEQSALGTSQFIENARYNLGLEGELAKTIMSLNAINNARVHLAIPKENLFVGRGKNIATAAVMLDVKSGDKLNVVQITSIINLVAGSVNNLSPESVSVTDQSGRLLSDDVNDGEYALASSKQIDYKESIEQQIKKQAKSMLIPILGANNFRIESAADIDFSKREETRETFDATPVLLSEVNIQNNDQSDIAIGIPGSLSSTPPVVDGQDNAPNNSKQKTHSESNRKYAVGSSVTHTEYQQGKLNHISLSVVINEDIAPTGEWTTAELSKIDAMISSAVGLDLSRGDSINVTSFTFSPIQVTNPIAAAWYEETRWQSLLKIIVSALVAMMLIFVVLRPLIKHITVNNSVKDAEQLPEEQNTVEQSTQDKEKEFALRLSEYGIGDSSSDHDLAMQMLPSPNSPLNVQIQHLQLISKEHPHRVSEILKNWVNA
ncbi:MAG: flagellar M-ring protein FliF [Psychromonas sp.]|jgi:flagellar M-ring protein FliF|uniref:flagellar basal-body MS-ring/collar protein FliF n=1 Tax=Psychromonas sp. TaxID=1884585 RepID=UPI0039E3CF75